MFDNVKTRRKTIFYEFRFLTPSSRGWRTFLKSDQIVPNLKVPILLPLDRTLRIFPFLPISVPIGYIMLTDNVVGPCATALSLDY